MILRLNDIICQSSSFLICMTARWDSERKSNTELGQCLARAQVARRGWAWPASPTSTPHPTAQAGGEPATLRGPRAQPHATDARPASDSPSQPAGAAQVRWAGRRGAGPSSAATFAPPTRVLGATSSLFVNHERQKHPSQCAVRTKHGTEHKTI